MSKIIRAPDNYVRDKFTVFLAGSIDNGKAEDWQTMVEKNLGHLDILILNPRRTNWDMGLTSTIDNPEFKEQVVWEMEGLERADLIFFYFAGDSIAPITLLELGLCARNKNVVVVCPERFWRKGNVDIVADRFDIPVFTNMAGGLSAIMGRVAIAEALGGGE